MNSSHPFQICIATGQNVVNLIPALQCGAEEVWILETPRMGRRNAGKHLRQALRNHDIRSEILPFPDTEPAAIRQAAVELAERVDSLSRRATINVTGGTKPMVLALVQEMAGLLSSSDETRPDIVYVDTRAQKLDWLGDVRRREDMHAQLQINDILRVYGYEHDTARATLAQHDKWLALAEDRFELTRRIVDNIDNKAAGVVKQVSALAGIANRAVSDRHAGKPFKPEQKFKHDPEPSLRKHLELLHEHNLLDISGRNTVYFRSNDAAVYCAGGWLEEYVAIQTNRVSQFGIQVNGNWRANVFPRDTDGKTLNEIDLMVAHNNRALAVECKAARLDDDNVNEWLDKLQGITRRIAGTQSGQLLVSARRLTPTQYERAELMRIGICSGADLKLFSRFLQRWMEQGSFYAAAS